MKNLVFPQKEIEKVAQQRLAICKECPLFSVNAKLTGYKSKRLDDHCTHCGCPIQTRIRAMGKACPINNWPAILSEEETEQLTKLKNDNKKHSTKGSNGSSELNAQEHKDD